MGNPGLGLLSTVPQAIISQLKSLTHLFLGLPLPLYTILPPCPSRLNQGSRNENICPQRIRNRRDPRRARSRRSPPAHRSEIEVLVESTPVCSPLMAMTPIAPPARQSFPPKRWANADVVLAVGMPAEDQIRQMHRGAVLAGLLSPHRNAARIAVAAEKGITALALEYLHADHSALRRWMHSPPKPTSPATKPSSWPPSDRPDFPDADDRGRYHPAGEGTRHWRRCRRSPGHRHRPPARSAGQRYDVRPAVKEQVQSLGAKFVELPLENILRRGRPVDMPGNYLPSSSTSSAISWPAWSSNPTVVITTAAIPGNPRLNSSPMKCRADADRRGHRRFRRRKRRKLPIHRTRKKQ